MKLTSAHIREFKSVWDSNPFKIGDVTCLVGKNEAGKTAILQALYRLNPLVDTEGEFDVTDDYPRSEVENYQQAIDASGRDAAVVVEATFTLDEAELRAVADLFGDEALTRPEVVLSKGYARSENGKCTRYVRVPVNETAIVKHLVMSFELPDAVKEKAQQHKRIAELAKHLAELATTQAAAIASAQAEANALPDEAQKAAAIEKSKALGESEQAKALRARLEELGGKDLGLVIWESLLRPSFPKFLYFDEYYQLRGHENVQALKQRQASSTLKQSDHPLLGLVELARLDLDKLLASTRTQDLKNKLQGASNYLSQQILKYWSQNRHLRMNFDVRPALPGDPEGMRDGTNIWGEVFDSKHLVSTGLGTRSRGFVWFFSFLAWYSAIKKQNEPLVLLLVSGRQDARNSVEPVAPA